MVEALNCTAEPGCTNRAFFSCRCRALICVDHNQTHAVSALDPSMHQSNAIWVGMGQDRAQPLLSIKDRVQMVAKEAIQEEINAKQRQIQQLNSQLEQRINQILSTRDLITNKIEKATNASLVLFSDVDTFIKRLVNQPPNLNNYNDLANLAKEVGQNRGMAPAQERNSSPVRSEVQELPQDAPPVLFQNPPMLFSIKKESNVLMSRDVTSHQGNEVPIEGATSIGMNGSIARLPDSWIFVVGGYSNRVEMDQTFICREDGTQVEVLQPIPEPRHSCGSAYYDGAVYVFGGMAKGQPLLTTAWKFDLQSRQWAEIRNLPSGIRLVSAVPLDDGILIAGSKSPKVYFYSPTKNSYEEYTVEGLDDASMKIFLPYEDSVFLLGNAGVFKTTLQNKAQWEIARRFEQKVSFKCVECAPAVSERIAYFIDDGKVKALDLENFVLQEA